MNQLDVLKQCSVVVADSGDFELLAQFAPREATTNPSLVLQAVQLPAYRPLLDQLVQQHRGEEASLIADRVLVAFGREILKRVPGRVSTEVDARLSFDASATVARADRILQLYASEGVALDRVLIKIAATWEGIQAARVLESRGVHTNLTLLFSLPQAMACAQAGVKLISPFVGRIYDWYKKAEGPAWNEAAHAGENDPGVKSVKQIHACYQRHGVKTEVMAASFRNTGQIIALAGCDLLTISPKLLGELMTQHDPFEVSLRRSDAACADAAPEVLSESAFRLAMNRDAMATEKLAEGIRAFETDAMALEALIEAQRSA